MSHAQIESRILSTDTGTDRVFISRQEKRQRDQAQQLETFLIAHAQSKRQLPRGPGGTVAIAPVLQAAGLALGSVKTHPALRVLAQKYADASGLCTVREFRASLPATASAERSPSAAMTYDHLLQLDALTLGVTERSLAAYRSSLRRFMNWQGKNAVDSVGAEMIGDFDLNRQNFIHEEFGGSARRASSSISCLNKYVDEYAKHQLSDGLPQELAAALSQLVQADGRTARDLSKIIGQRHYYVNTLMLGRQRSASRGWLKGNPNVASRI